MKHKMFLFAVVVFISTTNLFSQLSLEVVWEKPSAEITDAKFSPDGKFIYCAIGADIKKLDVATGEFVATFDRGELTGKNVRLELSADGRTIITGNTTGNGGLYLWDTEQQKVLREIKIDGITEDQNLYLASFAPDNKHLLLTLYTGHPFPQKPTNEILLFDLHENNVIKKVPYERIEQLHYSKDGKYFITGTKYEKNCRVTLWDANELTVIKEFADLGTNDNGFRKIQLSDNNKLIGVNVYSPNIFVNIIETETGNVVATNKFGTAGFNFNLLQNDYFIIFEEASSLDFGLSVYRYPNIFLSRLDKGVGDVLISYEIYSEVENKLLVFQAYALGMSLFTKSTTSVIEPTALEIKIRVETDTIFINFESSDSIKIIDIQGNKLLDMSTTDPNISIPNNYPAGTYICVIESGGKEYSAKFLVVE